MKNINFILILFIVACVVLVSCEKMVTSPNMPATYDNRPVKDQGTVYVSDRDVGLKIWDNGIVDGDIISLVVNDKLVLSNYGLCDFGNKKEIDLKFDNDGYNYILLFINEAGSVLSDTTALTIDDGTGEQDMFLSSDLTYCGAISVYVQ